MLPKAIPSHGMGQYTFPRSEHSRILNVVNASGSININPMDDEPLLTPGARWWRYTCDSASSRALLSISEREQLPGEILVTVSTDLRRLPLVW